MELKKVYVVLVNWRSTEDTVECLESIFASNYDNFLIVVCDNHSEDGSVEYITNWAESKQISYKQCLETSKGLFEDVCSGCSKGAASETSLVVIDTGSNLGFAGGNNVGIRYAQFAGDESYLWLLNNDTVVLPDTMSFLVKRLQEVDGAQVCSPTLLFYYRKNIVQALGGAAYNKWTGLAKTIGSNSLWPQKVNQQAIEAQLDYPIGASIFVTKQFIIDTGFMSEDYFLYFEELDWLLSSKSNKVLYAPDAIVYHKEGGSIGSSSTRGTASLSSYYWLFRSRIIFTLKFYPEAVFSVVLVAIAQLVRHSVSAKNFKILHKGVAAIFSAFLSRMNGK